MCVWGQGVYEKSLYLPLSFAVTLKMLQKLGTFYLKKKGNEIKRG